MSKTRLSTLVEALEQKQASLVAAESCTGGLFSDTITDIPGASAFYKGSVVAYTLEIKRDVLKVEEALIEEHGPVSKEVTEAMAKQVTEVLDADFSVAITGNAGPTAEQGKLGEVFIGAHARGGKTLVKRFDFQGNRWDVKHQAVNMAVEMLLELLEG
jgi:PncC family amidohydrolase